jgi:WD40 repeat protein/DNA-binding SARP family transcriptional activator
MELTVSFLGACEVLMDGQRLAFATNAARGLFAYLAAEAGQSHARSQLAELFWPDQRQEASFAALRTTLLRIRRAIPDPPGAEAVLDVTHTIVQFRREAATGDLFRFEDLLAECALHIHTDPVTCPACIARMNQAVALYRGEFLSGLALSESHPFEEWLLLKREQLHRRALEALGVLAQHHEMTGQFEKMRDDAARQLALEPWLEEAHAQMMRALTWLGDRAAALAQYEACRRLMLDELGIEPTSTLRALAERIRAGDLPKPAVQSPLPSSSPSSLPPDALTPDWGQVPETGPLFGRERELAQARDWLAHDRARLVWVFGMGGVGKTTLAAATTSAAGEQFDGVFWRSLLNAPPVEEVIRSALQGLSRNRIVEIPGSFDEQLAMLLDLLRRQRCLIVLDNLESLLQSEASGAFRPGYERYAQLILAVAQSRHGSSLLITSREQPSETARLNGSPGVHVLRLAGLSSEAGREMLAAYQLGSAGDGVANAQALVQRYSGNPLALKLVAQTVQEMFMGSIGDFLAADASIFDDVRTVLDSQFDRLSPLQREIMMWLAIEREAASISALRARWVHPPPPREFLEALQGLQRRSLLEHASAGESSAHASQAGGAFSGGASAFTLQNVIMEYVTDRLVAAACDDIEYGSLNTLNRHALLNAGAKEYVRQSQSRLILKPVADRLLTRLGPAALERRLHGVLDMLHAQPPRAPGYAAGNILNLLLHLSFDVAPYDFSRLCVWQADLRGVKTAALNLKESDLSRSAFTLSFNVWAIWLDDTNTVHIAGMSDGGLQLWQANDGQMRFAAHNAHPLMAPIVFSPDGRFVAHSSPDHTIYVSEAGAGTVLRTLRGHTAGINKLAFSPDGTRLASCSRDGTVRIWDVLAGEAIHTLQEGTGTITCLAFSPQNTLLAGGGEQRTITLWDAHAGHVLRTLSGHAREVECCTFSPDGAVLASGAHDGEIRLWNANAGETLRAFAGHAHIVRALVFHPSGDVLASSGADGTVRLWHARAGQLLHNLLGHAFDVNSLSFSPDGRTLATGSASESVRVWDTTTGYALDVFSGHSYMSRAVRFHPDPAAQHVVSADSVGNIHVWDLRTGASNALRGDALVVYSVAFSPDGRHLVSSGADGIVRVWDMATRRCLHELHGHSGGLKAVAVGAGGVIASAGTDRTIRLWPMARPDAVAVLHGHEDDVIGLAFDKGGQRLVSGSLDHTARVWSLREQHGASPVQVELCHVLRGPEVALYSVAISADGRRVVTNTWNTEMCWWDANTGERIVNEALPPLSGLGIVFNPDGKRMAVANRNTIEIRDATTHNLLQTLTNGIASLPVMDFDATSSRLATCDQKGVLCVWDVHTGDCLHRLRTPGPYAGSDITGAVGISEAQKAALRALGAVSHDD